MKSAKAAAEPPHDAFGRRDRGAQVRALEHRDAASVARDRRPTSLAGTAGPDGGESHADAGEAVVRSLFVDEGERDVGEPVTSGRTIDVGSALGAMSKGALAVPSAT